MPWARLDDGFDGHDKILALGTDQRRWTWVRILIFTARRGDPTVPPAVKELIPKATPAFLDDCLKIGLLDQNGGVLTVHDWDEYNQPKVEGDELVRRAALELQRDPTLSANAVARAIGGRRKDALDAIRKVRTGSQLVPSSVPGTTRELVTRADARPQPEPVPEPMEPESPSVIEDPTTKEARGEDEPAANDDDLFTNDQTTYLEPDRGPDLNGLDHLFTPGILTHKEPR